MSRFWTCGALLLALSAVGVGDVHAQGDDAREQADALPPLYDDLGQYHYPITAAGLQGPGLLRSRATPVLRLQSAGGDPRVSGGADARSGVRDVLVG